MRTLWTSLDHRQKWQPQFESHTKLTTVTHRQSGSQIIRHSNVKRPETVLSVVAGTRSTISENTPNGFQRSALVTIAACYPTTPTASLEVMHDIPPLHLWLRGTAIMAAQRMLRNGVWDTSGRWRHIPNSHIGVCDKVMRHADLPGGPIDVLPNSNSQRNNHSKWNSQQGNGMKQTQWIFSMYLLMRCTASGTGRKPKRELVLAS